MPLQLSPDQLILTRLREALPEELDGGAVGHPLQVVEEAAEAEAVHRLPLRLLVAEADPLLGHEELDHEDLVDVWSAYLLGVVPVEVMYDWSEGLPVQQLVGFGESVSEFREFAVLLLEDVLVEGVHGCCSVVASIRLTEGELRIGYSEFSV